MYILYLFYFTIFLAEIIISLDTNFTWFYISCNMLRNYHKRYNNIYY